MLSTAAVTMRDSHWGATRATMSSRRAAYVFVRLPSVYFARFYEYVYVYVDMHGVYKCGILREPYVPACVCTVNVTAHRGGAGRSAYCSRRAEFDHRHPNFISLKHCAVAPRAKAVFSSLKIQFMHSLAVLTVMRLAHAAAHIQR